jgi:hypothetical protein
VRAVAVLRAAAFKPARNLGTRPFAPGFAAVS